MSCDKFYAGDCPSQKPGQANSSGGGGGTGEGDMLKSVYDPDNDGKVVAAEYADAAGNAYSADAATMVAGVQGAGPSLYYGTDAAGNDGLFPLPSGGGGGGGAAELEDLTDVELTSPTEGQVLTYDFENAMWKNADPTGGGEVGPQYRPILTKLNILAPCIFKTAAGAVSIKAGTVVVTAESTVTFAVDTPVTMPATLNAGENYAVWVRPNGTSLAMIAPTNAGPYNWGAPPSTGAILIGGFHYSLTAPGTTLVGGSFSTTGFTNLGGNYVWTQAQVNKIAGINEYSIWDLRFRPKTTGLKGFAFDAGTWLWVAIYSCGTDHVNDGPSRAGTNVASGTVLPKIPPAYGGDGEMTYGRCSWYEASEIAQSHGCRLLEYNEFASAAFGVTEGQSLGGPSSTIPLTLRQPGYTSRIGLEQASGHATCWGATAHGQSGSEWAGGPNRGSSSGTPFAGRFGGNRTSAGNSGSRSVFWDIPAWNSYWYTSLRVACDHLSPM